MHHFLPLGLGLFFGPILRGLTALFSSLLPGATCTWTWNHSYSMCLNYDSQWDHKETPGVHICIYLALSSFSLILFIKMKLSLLYQSLVTVRNCSCELCGVGFIQSLKTNCAIVQMFRIINDIKSIVFKILSEYICKLHYRILACWCFKSTCICWKIC